MAQPGVMRMSAKEILERGNNLNRRSSSKSVSSQTSGQSRDPEDLVVYLAKEMLTGKPRFKNVDDEEGEYDGEFLKKTGYVHSQRIWDPDFFLAEAQRMFKMALSNQLEEALLECDLNMFKSFLYPMIKGGIIAGLCISSLDRDLIHQGIESFKIAAEMAYQVKPKRSWKNVLFRPDYNAYTDEEIMAEIIYCSAFGAIGGLTLLSDKSYKGLLTAAVHFNKSYKLYFEALNIAKYRKKWQHPLSKKQFDMGLKLSLGVSSLVFSFAPAKIARLLSMVGISTDLEQALADIHEVADSQDPFFFIPSCMTLLGYYGLLEPVYGVGEIRKDICVNLCENFITCDFYGNLRYFVLGAREVILGNLESSIAYEHKTRECLSYLGNSTVVTSVFNMLNFGLSGQLDKACECLELFDKMKIKAYLPSFLVYIHAAVLRAKMDDNPELEDAVAAKLREIKQTRGFFVLKKVFYEKMIETRSQQFVNDVQNWLLPHFEILYIGNFFYVIEGNAKYIEPMMEKVDQKLKQLAKNDMDYWDKYAFLLFFKAFFLKLSGNPEDALSYFHEILSLESIIERENQLIPQTCYEIGLIHRKNRKTAEAKRWLNKASKYTDYVTEFLIQWRCRYALSHMTPMEYVMPETMSHLPL